MGSEEGTEKRSALPDDIESGDEALVPAETLDLLPS